MGKAEQWDMLLRQDVSLPQKDPVRRFLAPPLEIVVAEDSDELRGAIAIVLRAAGYRVHTACGGESAKALIGDRPPSLVLTDLWMPAGSGWDLLLYCQTRWPLMPVVVMSDGPLGVQPEIECWAAGFLAKPFDRAHLLSEVGRLASRRTFTQNPNPAGLPSGRPAG